MKFRSCLAAVIMAAASAVSTAQTHTYKMLMSTTPGSGVANTVEKFSECFRGRGHVVIPDFAPGGDGLVAVKKFKATQDPVNTTTVFVGSFGVNMMGRWPDVDLVEDFNFVTYMTGINLVMVQKTGRYANLIELREASKIRSLNIGYTTPSTKFFAEIFAGALGFEIQTVPYKSSPTMIVDGLNGNLDLVIDTYQGIKTQIDSGNFSVITSTFENADAQKLGHRNIWQINPAAPKVPLGLIISVKPGVSNDAKNNLANMIHQCVQDPTVKTFLDQTFSAPVRMSGDDIKALVRRYARHQF